MAATYTNDKVSNNSSDPQIAKAGDVSVALDEKRRAALAEVDTAKFSYVPIQPPIAALCVPPCLY